MARYKYKIGDIVNVFFVCRVYYNCKIIGYIEDTLHPDRVIYKVYAPTPRADKRYRQSLTIPFVGEGKEDYANIVSDKEISNMFKPTDNAEPQRKK